MVNFEGMQLFHNSRSMKDWLLESRSRMILAGFLTVAMPLVGLTMYIYAQVVAEFRKVILEENETFFNLAVSLLEEKINTDISNGKIFADRPLLIEAIKRNAEPAVRWHLKSLIEHSNTIERAVVTTPEAVLLADYPEAPDVASMDFSRRDWYHGISRDWRPYVSDFYIRAAKPKRYVFSIAIPVKDKSGAVVGILVLQPRTDYLKNILGDIRIGNGFIYAVDKKGNLIITRSIHWTGLLIFQRFPQSIKQKKACQGLRQPLTLSPMRR